MNSSSLRATPIIHGIAGGEDHRVAATQGFHLLDNGREGLRPFQALGLQGREKAEEALGAHDHIRVLQREFGTGGQALKAILAHADDGEPLRHARPFDRPLTQAAAMAVPPRRPRSRGIGNAARVPYEFILRLRRADKAHGEGGNGGGPWAAGIDHFEQGEQCGGGIADHHEGTFQIGCPQFHRGGGTGGLRGNANFAGAGIIQGADDLKRSCR